MEVQRKTNSSRWKFKMLVMELGTSRNGAAYLVFESPVRSGYLVPNLVTETVTG